MPHFHSHDYTRFYYKDWGHGAPVVFVHGFALNADCWDNQMPYLVDQGLRCIAYDRRGCGRTDQPYTGYDLDSMADDLAALIAQLGLREVTLVGHSMGTSEITRYLSRRGSAHIARCILIAPTTPCLLRSNDNPDGIDIGVMDQQMGELLSNRAGFFTKYAPAFFGVEAGDAQWQPTLTWGIAACMQTASIAALAMTERNFRTDLRAEMSAFDVPTMVIQGGRDSTPADITGVRTAQLIPGCKLQFYPDAPHGLIFTHKHEVNRDLLAFIEADRATDAPVASQAA
jgi:non-heme chloroperoxidase